MYETFYYSNAPINAKDCSISNPSWLEKHQGGSWSRRPWLSCHGQSASWGIILPYIYCLHEKISPRYGGHYLVAIVNACLEGLSCHMLPTWKISPRYGGHDIVAIVNASLEGLSCHMLPPWKKGKVPGQPQNLFVTLDCCGLSWKLECARSRFPSHAHN